MYGFLRPCPLQLDNLNNGSHSPPKLVSVTPHNYRQKTFYQVDTYPLFPAQNLIKCKHCTPVGCTLYHFTRQSTAQHRIILMLTFSGLVLLCDETRAYFKAGLFSWQHCNPMDCSHGILTVVTINCLHSYFSLLVWEGHTCTLMICVFSNNHDVLMFRYCDIDTRQNSGFATVFSLFLLYGLQLLTRGKSGKYSIVYFIIFQERAQLSRKTTTKNTDTHTKRRLVYLVYIYLVLHKVWPRADKLKKGAYNSNISLYT